MGTRIAVEVWHGDPAAAEEAIDAVIAEMRRIDALMSTYKPESQLSRVNREAAARPVKVDPELARLVARALEFSRDVRRGLRHHLRERRLPVRLPGRQAPDRCRDRGGAARRSTGVTWPWTGRLDHPVPEARRAHRPRRHRQGPRGRLVASPSWRLAAFDTRLVTAGGDSRILGDRRGRPWIVGIRHPDDPGEVIARIPLEDAAISTSGDYERFFDEDGVRYHHIIDPKTGKSPHGMRSVTIIAPTSTLAEGLDEERLHHGPGAGIALRRGAAGRGRGGRHRRGQGALFEGLAPTLGQTSRRSRSG